jgi:uncharacterized protein (DUF433 family)
MAQLDWSQCQAVESIPGKVGGAWVLQGTRMPVQAIFENLAAGLSVKEITEVNVPRSLPPPLPDSP